MFNRSSVNESGNENTNKFLDYLDSGKWFQQREITWSMGEERDRVREIQRMFGIIENSDDMVTNSPKFSKGQFHAKEDKINRIVHDENIDVIHCKDAKMVREAVKESGWAEMKWRVAWDIGGYVKYEICRDFAYAVYDKIRDMEMPERVIAEARNDLVLSATNTFLFDSYLGEGARKKYGKNPFGELMKFYELGLWPAGFSGRSFYVWDADYRELG